MDKLKIGIIGTGFSAASQIEAIRRLPNAEITAIAASSMEKAERKAKEYGIPTWYDSAYSLIEDQNVEIVHNCTPNHLHFPLNKAALIAGKHVLSEKPLGMNSRESAELAELAEASGKISGVCFNYRHFPLVAELKASLDNNAYGRPFLVSGGYFQDWMLYNTDYNWRLNTEFNGSSRAIADIGSHWCDLIQYVTGQKIVEVFADLQIVHPIRYKRVPTGRETHLEEIGVSNEDCGNVLLRFSGGLRGSFTVSQVSAGRKNRLIFEVAAETASIAWDQEDPNRMWIGKRGELNWELIRDTSVLSSYAASLTHYPGGHQEGWPDALKNLIQNFYESVNCTKSGVSSGLGDHRHFATFTDGHQTMQIIDAIIESNRTGRWINTQMSNSIIRKGEEK